jgi:hypothetical protein
VHTSIGKTIVEHVKRFQTKGLILEKKRTSRSYMLAKEKNGEIRARGRHLQKKSMVRLARQNDVSASSAQLAKYVSRLQLYKTTVVHALYDTDRVAGVNFTNWYLQHLFCLATKLGVTSVDT